MTRIIEDIYYSNYPPHRIFDTKHSISRWSDENRFDNRAGKKELKDLVIKVINDGIAEILNDYQNHKNTYIIHSQSTGLGIVIDWRQDNFESNKQKQDINHAFIVTILGFKKSGSFFKKKSNDSYLWVESQLYDWAKKSIKLTEGREVVEEKNTSSFDHTESINGFMVCLYEGKYKDVTGEIIIVE